MVNSNDKYFNGELDVHFCLSDFFKIKKKNRKSSQIPTCFVLQILSVGRNITEFDLKCTL